MSGPPVVLLDVDGVINTFQPSWGADLVKVNVAGIPIRYAPVMVERLHQVLDGAEVRWSTTWCGLDLQIARLNEILGFDFPCAFGHRPMSKTWGDMKVEAALSVLAEGRRVVWADDEEAAAGRRLFPEIARPEREGRALLITPDSVLGLQPEDLDLIEAFLKGDQP